MKPADSELTIQTEDPHVPAAPAPRQKPTERAFVVQFDPVESTRSRLHGRVEVVASGEHTRFRSLKELVAFMVHALHRRTGGEY